MRYEVVAAINKVAIMRYNVIVMMKVVYEKYNHKIVRYSLNYFRMCIFLYFILTNT